MFLVMYLFLQNLRYTLIPTIVVPVALLGAFGVMLVVRLLDQRADDVRDGARGRHPGRRRDRRDRERRAHHERGRACRRARRPRRRWARSPRALIGITRDPGLGVPADGLLRRLGGQHLSPVLAGDGERDAVLGVPRAVAHAGPVRDLPQAGRGRPQAREARLLRLVQPRLQGDDARLRGLGRADPAPHRPLPDASFAAIVARRRADVRCACRPRSCRPRTRAT